MGEEKKKPLSFLLPPYGVYPFAVRFNRNKKENYDPAVWSRVLPTVEQTAAAASLRAQMPRRRGRLLLFYFVLYMCIL